MKQEIDEGFRVILYRRKQTESREKRKEEEEEEEERKTKSVCQIGVEQGTKITT